jgi:hypothetical protein
VARPEKAQVEAAQTRPALRVLCWAELHARQTTRKLGGGLKDAGWMREHMSQNRLAILPDVTHYEMFLAPELPRTVRPFLDGKSGSKTWAEQVQGK